VPVPRFWVEHLRVAGIWSYSIYLLHQPLLHVIAGASSLLTRELHPLLVFSLCVSSWLLILPLSNLWYRVVELPSIEQGKRVLALRRLAPGL